MENKIIKEESVQSRFSEAPWAEDAENHHLIIGGTGGIGSWLNLFLSSINYSVHIYDFDTIELHNLGGQFFGKHQIGTSKVQAIKENIIQFRDSKNVTIYQEPYAENSLISPIMISAFDNMKARKVMFENWKTQEDRVAFIDGRQLAEMGMVYCVLPGQENLYENELFDDSEVLELNCNYKATTHCGALTASLLTTLVTNVIYNQKFKAEIRTLPFKLEFNLSALDFTKT